MATAKKPQTKKVTPKPAAKVTTAPAPKKKPKPKLSDKQLAQRISRDSNELVNRAMTRQKAAKK